MRMWIARDKDGLLLTNEKPILSVSKTNWLTSGDADYIVLDEEMFPEVTFENSPRQITLILDE